MALLTRFFDTFVDPKAADATARGSHASHASQGRAAATTFQRMSGAPSSASPVEWMVLLALLAAPIVYLSIRHGIHISLYLLAILGAFAFASSPARFRNDLQDPWITPLLLSLSALFVAAAVTQLLSRNFHLASYDSPSKILLAGLILLFLRQRTISFAKVLEVALPLGLLLLQAVLWMYPEANLIWDGTRYATSFVDPNSLGSQSLILTFLCLFSIRLFGREKPWLLALKLVAVVVGFCIALYTRSRGAWLAIPPMMLLWLVLYFCCTRREGAIKYLLPLALVSAALAAMFLGYEYSTIISTRGNFAYNQLCDWVTGRNLDTPVGMRLSMWKISLALAQDSPWFGYGKVDFRALMLQRPDDIPVYRTAIDALAFAGPHSDILAKQLSMGIIGVLAYLATLLVPWCYFWTHRRDSDTVAHAASHLGMYFITGIFFCGLANEMMSLKYLCSFFGLMIAGLAADVSRRVK